MNLTPALMAVRPKDTVTGLPPVVHARLGETPNPARYPGGSLLVCLHMKGKDIWREYPRSMFTPCNPDRLIHFGHHAYLIEVAA